MAVPQADLRMELFEKCAAEFQCGFCRNVAKDPVETPCDHVFCRGCVEEGLKHKQECPVCRKVLNVEDLKKFSGALQRTYGNLKLTCPYGCNEKGLVISNLPSHEEDCPSMIVSCSTEGCTEEVQRCAMVEHEGVCPWRIVDCHRSCGATMRANEVKDHNKTCPRKSIRCRKCNGKHARMDAIAHKKKCPERLMSCPIPGCSHECLRKEMDLHLNETPVMDHLLAMAITHEETIDGLKETIDALEETIDAHKRLLMLMRRLLLI